MNKQAYVSGNLALSVEPESNPKLIVINGGQASYCGRAIHAHIDDPFASCKKQIQISRIALYVIACLFAFFITYQVSSAMAAPTYEKIQQMDLQTIKVREGETLWGLAEMYDADGITTQDMVSAIKDWNDLDSSMLKPGQSLLVASPLQE